MANAIDAKDIFAPIIRPSECDAESLKKVKKNIQMFMSRVPNNIFENEYFALYEAISKAKRFSGILTYKQFNEIVLRNIERLISSPYVDIGSFADDVHDEQAVRKDFLNLCMASYKELSEYEDEEEDFLTNLELYVESFVQDRAKQLYTECAMIATKGLSVRNKFYQGHEDAHKYYVEQQAKVNALISSDSRVSRIYSISPKGYEQFKEKEKQAPVNKVSNTMIDSIDDEIGDFRKGDVVTVQGYTSSGKTRFATNIEYNAIMRGHTGISFVLEGKVEQKKALLVARHIAEKYQGLPVDSKMIYEKTYPDTLKDIVDAMDYDLFHNDSYGRLHLITPPIYDEDIIPMLDSMWEDADYGPFDFVTLDYMSLLESKRGLDTTKMLEHIVPILKNTAVSFKDAGFLLNLVQQIKTETWKDLMDGKDTTLYGASDSSIVPKSSDIVLTVHTDDEMKLSNRIWVYGSKVRDSQGFSRKEVSGRLGQCYYRDIKEA